MATRTVVVLATHDLRVRDNAVPPQEPIAVAA
jgi:hypothetical protein